VDKSNQYLELAFRYFQRAEQADNPVLQAKLRKLAGEYRDKALEMIDRAIHSPNANFQSVPGAGIRKRTARHQ
jgi:hypothetical protein